MIFTFRGMTVPDHMIDALRRYAASHIEPGDFLLAVLRNDLRGAVMRADDINIGLIPAYVAYCYNELPGNCWGSPEAVRAWLARRDDSADDDSGQVYST